ncbi:tetratricopeptide [Colletotrichum higginsianum]|nr:tetratricopeptide [Colletotrichum higginsianum]
MAATLYCLNRQDEAEKCWLAAIKTRPQYLEAVEHLVGLLYKKKSSNAVEVISFMQKALRLSVDPVEHVGYSSSTLQADTPTDLASNLLNDNRSQPGFGSSGYAIPGTENGRILALVHAKGTMLYSLKDIAGASKAFEEAVLISTGRRTTSVQTLVQHIQQVLAPNSGIQGATDPATPARPLLLAPEKARRTAKLVFSNNGDLPGLRFVPEGGPKRAAIQTTSNSLLSLAKIFQDAMSSGPLATGVARKSAGVGDILCLYYLSLSLQESPSTANNVGILLASVQQPATANSSGMSSSLPNIPGILPGSGLALALAYYNYGLTLDPKHVHLHTNLGSLLKDIGQLDLAIQMYEQAVQCDGNFDIALTNLANAVKDRGRISDAIAYYKRAVRSNPEFAEAVCGLSTALNSVCDWRGRGGALLQGGGYDRWHVGDDGMIFDATKYDQGSGLTKKVTDIVSRQLADASTWGLGVLQKSYIAVLAAQLRRAAGQSENAGTDFDLKLRSWSQTPWEGSRLLRLVERATRASMRQWYCDKYIRGLKTTSKYERPQLPSNLTVPSAPTVLPFHTFTCPLTAKDIRMISQRNALRISCSTLRSAWLPSTVYPPPPPPSPCLNVGYVSSDFNNHPLAHLMQSVFGFHDRTRIMAFCYATTASDKSVHRLQIEREAPVFRDASTWTSDKLVEQIVQDNIHILVNLNGYTRGARNEIFAARPAPIQMSFMGFAGTLGAEWCDYLLADTTAIPPETLRPWRGNLAVSDVFEDKTEEGEGDWIYSENIIYCKDTFFCCDHAQSSDPDEHKVSWQDEQQRRWKMRKELFPDLPDDTIIMGNFNQLYKIDPTTFRTWLRILSKVDKSILWLLRFPELGETNLRRTAKAWAGEEVARRIIFTDVAPKNQHISRARVCDLFLDTPECNAHTTAADILWSSTPLLTLPRYPYKMCSRMAASILKGALPNDAEGLRAAKDLIAGSEDEYEEFAVRLAKGLSYCISPGGYGEGHGRLATLRKLLWDSKWTCALFDTRRWVADLESAYNEAWRRWVAGEDGDIYL